MRVWGGALPPRPSRGLRAGASGQREPPTCGNARPPPAEPSQSPSLGHRSGRPTATSRCLSRAKVRKRCTAPPSELPPRYKSPKKVHCPAAGGGGPDPRATPARAARGRSPRAPRRRPPAPRAGRIPARPARCAEKRPGCISRQENYRRCAENRPECVSRQRPTGARRARTGREPLHAFWETAGQDGGIVLVARRAARGGSGRRRRGAEIAPPGDALCPIFSTTTPFRLPENTLWSIFSTCSAVGSGLEGCPTLGEVRPLRPRSRCAPGPAATLVKTPVRWRVESRKTRLRGQKRLPLEANPADRLRIPARGAFAPVAAAAKPQFRGPYQEAWSKPALSVPTVKAGFDHGGR